MKFGICSEIFKDWNDTARTFNYVKETGYDGIEIAPFTLSQYATDIPQSTRADIVNRAAEVDLDVLGIHWVLVGPEGVYINHKDQAIREHTSQYLLDLCRLCSDLGGKVMIFGSPKQRNVMDELRYEEAFNYTKEAFERTLPLCEQLGVTWCMEPLARTETNFCTTAAETVKLIEAIDHPNFRLLLDVKAMSDEQEGYATIIKRNAKHLAHFHCNDENLEGPGFGDVDFAPIFQALKEINYQDYASVEVFKFNPGPESIATKSLEYMQQFA